MISYEEPKTHRRFYHPSGVAVLRRMHEALPATITKNASKQTYYTILFLVDRDRISDAYRAYAYFRWVDDWIDQGTAQQSERIAFVKRQQTLSDDCYRGEWSQPDLTAEEHILVDLIRSDPSPNSGLHSYIYNMMAVMIFDAGRRGRLISEQELTQYARYLSVAVTDAMHYFIGHDQCTPQNDARYLAVTAAHITHMLRDTCDDSAAGYFNIPSELLAAHQIDPRDVESDLYRAWVRDRVELARTFFKMGQGYLAQVKCMRCRIAGYAYIARFVGVLDAIERDSYRLRSEYLERKSLRARLRTLRFAFAGALRIRI
jgi:Phytoene/squalene synthetase